MFKSIQWKLVLMFVLLVISVMIIVGTYLLNSTTDFYHNQFIQQMDSVFNQQDFQNTNYSINEISEKIKTFAIQLGIDSYRDYYVFDNRGKMIISSKDFEKDIEYSPNLIKALNGKIGKRVNTSINYVDYALPVYKADSDEVKYVIYIKDTKEELVMLTSRINNITIYSVLFGVLISIGLGFLLSNTITTPISVLTKNAEKLANRDFKEKIEVMSKDEIGQLTKTFNFMASELEHNMQQIASEKNMMEAILTNMTDGLIAFNMEGKVIHANPAAVRMLGLLNAGEIDFDEYFGKLGLSLSLEDLINNTEWVVVKKNININNLNIKAYFVPFKVEEYNTGGVVAVFQDVTEQQKLDEARREFVANVSHELRTPLTSIKSYTETLLEGAIDDKETSKEFLNVINNESDRMARLVKDLLLLSKLDYKQQQWEFKQFDLKKLIADTIENLRISAEKNKHTLEVKYKAEELGINGDKDRIEQVLINIISNAIKYTPDGGKIEVEAGKEDNNVYIKVKDNGIGIPEEDLERIFERFYRVDKGRSRQLGGTGLGLAIAKEIIETHKGKIYIESKQNVGTQVIIVLPTGYDIL